MKTYYANKKHTIGGFNQYSVAENALVLENIRVGISDKMVVYFSDLLLNGNRNEYLFRRFDKYVGFIQYRTDNGLFMSLSEFTDIETAVDLHYYFRQSGWTEEQILIFTKLADDAINTDYEDCEVKMV